MKCGDAFALPLSSTLQTPPISNVLHIVLGAVAYHHPKIIALIVAYTMLKVHCVSGQNYGRRLKSLCEICIGYAIAHVMHGNTG